MACMFLAEGLGTYPTSHTLAHLRMHLPTLQVPLGHMGEKVDIAMACVFLASRGARYVSGTTLVVDGAEWLYK